MSAPGVGPAPGMQQASQQPGRPGASSGFQPPANLPSNINFNAPVIRLGTTGPGKPQMSMGDPGRRESNNESRSGRPGLGAGMGMEAQRQAVRENMLHLIPPTKEEILKTIFVGGITEGISSDDGIERILQCAGHLRRWTRAMDAENKACRFGFAEYEDPDSLSTAVDVLKDVEVPIKQQMANGVKKDDDDGDDVKVEKSKLMVCIYPARFQDTADFMSRSWSTTLH